MAGTSGRQQTNQTRNPLVPARKPVPKKKKKKSGPKHFENTYTDIIMAACIVILPMLILSGVFLGLVYRWMVSVSAQDEEKTLFSTSRRLVNNTQSVSNSFFIDVDATRLVTIASWSSTVVTFLPSWMMLLAAYPLTRELLSLSKGRLPTAYQMHLFIELLGARYGALWSWLTYRLAWKKKSRGNSLVASTLVAFLVFLTLAGLILGADTRLHLTTTTVLLQQIEPTQGEVSNFSMVLSANCLRNPGDCTISPPLGGDQGSVINAANAYRVLFNASNNISVLSTTMDDQNYNFYAAANLPSDRAYRAKTLAMNTQCVPVTRACNLTMQYTCIASGATLETCPQILALATVLPFNCSPALSGDLRNSSTEGAYYSSTGDTGFFLSYFKDLGLTQLADFWTLSAGIMTWTSSYFANTKPWVFVVGAKVAIDEKLAEDSEVVSFKEATSTFAGSGAFLLECSSQLLNMTYNFSNGTVTELEVEPASKEAIAAITVPSLMSTSQMWDSLVADIRAAGLHPTMKDVAAAFADSYSHAMLSMGAGALSSAPALQEGITTFKQITRMPKAPFFALVTLNLLYAVVGIILTVFALTSEPEKVKPVQARLSVKALLAALFPIENANSAVMSLDDLFEESLVRDAKNCDRVKLACTNEGGWRYEKDV